MASVAASDATFLNTGFHMASEATIAMSTPTTTNAPLEQFDLNITLEATVAMTPAAANNTTFFESIGLSCSLEATIAMSTPAVTDSAASHDNLVALEATIAMTSASAANASLHDVCLNGQHIVRSLITDAYRRAHR
jgi:hypothetical protein